MICVRCDMGVSINGATPKWMFYFMEIPNLKWMMWGYLHDFGNLHVCWVKYYILYTIDDHLKSIFRSHAILIYEI